MTFIDLTSARIHYQLLGQGTPVVFINGWTQSCEYWLPMVELLKARHLCLIYDQRGFGRSQPLAADAGVELDDHAEDLHELINRLGLKDVNLVGHGIGAWIALSAARHHPQDVLTLSGLAPESEPTEEEKGSEIPSIWQQASLLLKDLASVPMVRNLVAWRYRRAPEPYRTRLFDDFAQADRRAAFHLLAGCMGKDNQARLQNMLGEVMLPVLLVRGWEDSICPAAALRAYFEIIKSGKMATIRGCGHFPMLEFSNELAALLRDFFTQNSGPQHVHALTGRQD
jgi:pimeloyl-ACP methyl ester carboxylesterase